MNLLTASIGFFVGCAVAATGIGGGVLLTPLLILVLRIAPVEAVGTALAFMSVTKLVAVLMHWKQKTVDFPLAGYLALGSIPGTVAGAAGLAYLHSRMGQSVNAFLQITIAASLIGIALFSILFEGRKPYSMQGSTPHDRSIGYDPTTLGCIGFAGGLLVSTTSVGSGSLIILLLLAFCPRSPTVLVGTDIFHGMVLTIVAALLHFRLNPIDVHIVKWLLLGSVVGVVVGTQISVRLPPNWLRRCLLVLALLGGLVMMFAPRLSFR